MGHIKVVIGITKGLASSLSFLDTYRADQKIKKENFGVVNRDFIL